ncbi:MAG: UDP-N-acetylmuramate dehydrogenase [Anaplasmataceae bacterium]|nr:UDP-N-acetylmuramate dehydrogenase [Anaplasmataceae bacterium]
MLIKKQKKIAPLTKFRIGGYSKYFAKPDNIDDLNYLIDNYFLDDIFILGAGSNLLVRDGGIDGITIRLGATFNFIEQDDMQLIKVGCATLDCDLAKFACKNGIGGFEFLIGIPGTIGGGIAMNAGAYNRSFEDIILEVKALDLVSKKIVTLSSEEIGFCYRGNSLSNYLFLEGLFIGYKDSIDNIKYNMNSIVATRNISQPILSYTCGSTFQNPINCQSWKLLKEVGCDKLSVGDANFSPLHCNFIINNGNAKSKDIEELIHIAENRVFDKFGILLKKEIRIIGDDICY